QALEERAEPTVVVLRGAGDRAFCAGFDLDVDRSETPTDLKQRWPEMTDAIGGYPYPVLGMITGDTYGGGVEVAAACDIRLGARDARFAVTPAKIGLVYGGRAVHRIMRLVGPAKTKELLFTAEPVDADHAAEVGLLNYAVDREALADRTYDMADTIAGNAPFSLRKMKQVVDMIHEKGRLSEAETRWVARVRDEAFNSEDHTEGVAAFREGRDPDFQGQ
ncbi:MAG: enoyl-CoA hydratase/carnithine racemase, partial [Salinirussus sp.]